MGRENEMQNDGNDQRRPVLPKRDIVLLPLIFVITLFVVCSAGEIVARIVWPESLSDACAVPDSTLGHRAKPNCTSRLKTAEGPWVTNYYNECGYRTDQSCLPRTRGTLRIDLMGSSTAQGYLVPYPDTIGATLVNELTAQCHRDVQVENMAMFNYQQKTVLVQLQEALSLKPDMLLFMVQPQDFEREDNPMARAPASPELLPKLRELAMNLRIMEMMQHFIYLDAARYTSIYLNYRDTADFLRSPLSSNWQQRLDAFSELLDQFDDSLKPAGVPMAVIYVPSHAQAAFLGLQQRPRGIDPFLFGDAVGKVVAAHGFRFINLSTAFSQVDDPASLYYAQNGHLTAKGDPIVGQNIAASLLGADRGLCSSTVNYTSP